jgi:hypothetical protein
MQLAAIKRFAHQARPWLRKAKVAALRSWRNPKQREHAAVAATYVMLAAFAVVSIDSMVTGSAPQWQPSEAYAMEVAPAAREAVSAPVIAAPLNLAPALPQAVTEQIDYSVATEELLGGPDTILASLEFDTSLVPAWFQGDLPVEFAYADKPEVLAAEPLEAAVYGASGKDK